MIAIMIRVLEWNQLYSLMIIAIYKYADGKGDNDILECIYISPENKFACHIHFFNVLIEPISLHYEDDTQSEYDPII